MFALIYLFSLLFAGQMPLHPQPPKPPASSDKRTDLQRHIEMLQRAASKKHLRWRVFCTDFNPDWVFQGWAVSPGDDFYIYDDEGAKKSWSSHGSTQDETVYKLYLAIQGPENSRPIKRERERKKHDLCPPELRSE